MANAMAGEAIGRSLEPKELNLGKIQEEMNNLDELTETLPKIVTNLEDRLSPILSQPRLKDNMDDMNDTEYGIIYADSIKRQRRKLENIEHRLNEIISRIEL